MLTPQEVTSVVFEKAVFGGYEIGSVDKFLNQLTKDYSSLYRDNELLKNRLSAMADKIEEYRVNEDAMRLALLSAKKTVKEMSEKAKPEPVQQADMPQELRELAAELEKEKAALRQAREATAAYLAGFREVTANCEEALKALLGEAVSEAAKQETTAEIPVAAVETAEKNAGEMSFAELNFSRR